MTTSFHRAAPVVAAAVRDTVPVAASIAPLGLVIGATAAGAGVPVLADVGAAAAVFAGAAHLAALTTLAAGAGALTALGTAALAWRRRGIVLPVAAGLAATWVLSVL